MKLMTSGYQSMKIRLLLCALLLVVPLSVVGTHSAESGGAASAVTVVDNVDLKRYIGTWYEIAHIPVWFQKECDSGSTAEYSLAENGEINVINRCCTKEGNLKEAKGRAWMIDKSYPAKLKVGFFSVLGFFPFKGDYWIIDLDPAYRFAVIGHPSRKLGWILSRTPQLSTEVMAGIADRLKQNGYDISDFKMTDQSRASCFR